VIKMRVTLLSHTKDPEKVVYEACRISRGSSLPMETLIPNVLSKGHFSVLEHVSFTFLIEDISRVCSHQLVRHRIASYTQESQRCVRVKDFILPKSLEENEKVRLGLNAVATIYEKLLQEVKEEDARYIMPQASSTRILMTMNGRSLLNFFWERCCFRAQDEIRELAWRILEIIKTKFPLLFDYEFVGPKCFWLLRCPEDYKNCPYYWKWHQP